MNEQGLKYEDMVEEALRGVVRKALSVAATRGLPGNHHFYITFRTDHPGADLPPYLRERYNNEMTIVLQYQFENLVVTEEDFSVTLSFSEVPARLTVPFDAVIAFADPSVRFALQFEARKQEGDSALPAKSEDAPEAPKVPAPTPAAEPPAPADADAESSGKVVTLDRFRKS